MFAKQTAQMSPSKISDFFQSDRSEVDKLNRSQSPTATSRCGSSDQQVVEEPRYTHWHKEAPGNCQFDTIYRWVLALADTGRIMSTSCPGSAKSQGAGCSLDKNFNMCNSEMGPQGPERRELSTALHVGRLTIDTNLVVCVPVRVGLVPPHEVNNPAEMNYFSTREAQGVQIWLLEPEGQRSHQVFIFLTLPVLRILGKAGKEAWIQEPITAAEGSIDELKMRTL
ncbi:hypothetical protein BDN72DRAFT_854839 [Pluteus cervinus]|uniref:Uncharacterized protein n=1 Tax=Pluteus cervinus TaxID=181527 RepID=A0ACD3B6U7_9AGAR|nr:hypothetical protein BDN72DRAFT_854839 [Pluteus cervinus]